MALDWLRHSHIKGATTHSKAVQCRPVFLEVSEKNFLLRLHWITCFQTAMNSASFNHFAHIFHSNNSATRCLKYHWKSCRLNEEICQYHKCKNVCGCDITIKKNSKISFFCSLVPMYGLHELERELYFN